MSLVPELLVLDPDGVVFSSEFEAFVRVRSARRSLDPDESVRRWSEELRDDFWSGRTNPSGMWAALFPGDNPAQLTAELEQRYRPGPAFAHAARGDRRVWILANDRSGWLEPRLRRFGLTGHIERVIVSDRLGAVLPNQRVLDDVAAAARSAPAVVVSRDPNLLAAAAERGLPTRTPEGTPISAAAPVAA